MIKNRVLYITLIVFVCLVLSSLFIISASAAGSVSLTADFSTQQSTIGNIWSTKSVWNCYNEFANAGQQNLFSTKYPFIKELELFTATGGNSQRDQLVDPDDPSQGYDFSSLINVCDNILYAGTKPMIKTGMIPVKFSDDYVAGDYGFNKRPPSASYYTAYYNYIHACADALVNHFGLSEVRSWRWGVLTEVENPVWFVTSDGLETTTREAFCKIYDYTVAALEASLGASYLNIGAHSLGFADKWNISYFIQHCASGTNYYTGGTGTQLDYLDISYYIGTGAVASGEGIVNNYVRNSAIQNGFTNLKYGVSEGYFGGDPDDGVGDTWTRMLGDAFQSSLCSKMFKIALDNGVDNLMIWCPSTDGFEVDAPFINALKLFYKMRNDKRVPVSKSGTPANSDDDVNSVSSYDSTTNKAHVLVYNHNKYLSATTSEDVIVTLNNIAAVSGSSVTVTKYYLDENNGSWWKTWWDERGSTAPKIDSMSKHDYLLPSRLLNQSDIDYWNANKARYAAIGQMTSSSSNYTVSNNKIILTPTLGHHGVVLYEITNIKPSGTSPTPTPGATATPTPADPTPTPGGTLLDENFNDGAANNWTVDSGNWNVSSGVYHQTTTSGRGLSHYANGTSWTDYTYSASVKAPASGAKTGITFRGNSAMDNYYVLRFTGTSSIEFSEVVDGNYALLQSYGCSVTAGNMYTLKVQANGSNFTFYLDSTQLGTKSDASHSNGTVGSYTYDTAGDFDDALATGSGGATPTPTPTPGGALLDENFNDGAANNWTVDSGSWNVSSGVYHQTATSGRGLSHYANGTSWTDYTYSASVKAPASGAKTGITFRGNSAMDNYYVLRFNGMSIIEFSKVVDGTYTLLQDYGCSVTAGNMYTLKVQVDGSNFTFYLDSTQLGTDSDTSHSSGTVGSYTYDTAGDFDDALATGSGGATPTPGATATPTPTPTPTPTSSELLSNPGFEDGTTGWTGNGSCTISSISDPVYNGSKALSITNRADQYGGNRQNVKNVLLSNGQGIYNIGAWMRTQSGTFNGKVQVWVKYNGGQNSYFTTSATSLNSSSWTNVSASLNITWTGTLEDAELRVFSGDGTSYDFYCDDCSLKVAP